MAKKIVFLWGKITNTSQFIWNFLKAYTPTAETPWIKKTWFHARRWGLKIGFELLKIYWFVARPESEGAKCVIVHQGKVLLIRHTYGPKAWTVPGGGMKKGESPEDAARREIREETGLVIERLFHIGRWTHTQFHKEDTIHFFFGETWEPAVTVDRIEVNEADWFGPLALPYPVGETAIVGLKLYEEFVNGATVVLPRP